MMDFKWIGSKVECYCDNPLVQRGCFDYYTSFSYNSQEFRVGEFALFKQSNKNADFTRIGRLLCVFHSHEGNIKYKGLVHWYTWARNLQSKMNSLRAKFDEKNEVVEEMPTLDTLVSLKDIQKKCTVTCFTLNEPIYLIKKYNLNPDVHFSCRYKMEGDQLVPYFSEESMKNTINEDYIVISELSVLDGKLKQKLEITDVSEDSEFSDIEKICSGKDIHIHEENSIAVTKSSPFTKTTPIKTSPTTFINYKRKSNHTATPIIDLDSEGSDVDEKYADKVRSPSNPLKNIKLTPKSNDKKLNGSLSSPLKRNLSVKRVLNDSFENHPTSPSGIPIFSYSVINSNYNDPKHIKIKLKLTENQTDINLKVFPTKLGDEIVQIKSPIKIGDLQEKQNRIEFSPNAKAKISDTLLTKCDIDSPRRFPRAAQVVSPYTPAKIHSTRRRSSRTVERKSYVEYYSPEQNTPKKRGHKQSTDSYCLLNVRTPFKEIIETKTSLSKIHEDPDLDNKQRIKIERIENSDDHDRCNNIKVSAVVISEDETKKCISHFNAGIPNHKVGQSKRYANESKEYNNQSDEDGTSKYNVVSPRKDINEDSDSISSSSSDENDGEPAENTSKQTTPRTKHKVEELLTNNGSSVSCNRTKKIRLISNSNNKCNEKLLATSPRPKRIVGTPKRYTNDDSVKEGNLTPKQKRHMDRSKKCSDNRSSDSTYSAKASRPIRNVARPKKYGIDEDIDSTSNAKSPRLKQSVAQYPGSDNGSPTNNVQSRRGKRNADRPKKYIESSQSDDSDSDDHRSKNNKSHTKNNLIFKTPTKTPYSTRKTSSDDLRKSILKSACKKLNYPELNEEDFQPRTPKAQRERSATSTPKSTLKDTPTARARMIREGIITPSVQARNKAVLKDNTPLSKARTQLHVSFVPKSLPCREKEFADIINFLEGKLLDGCGGCMYVSGVPGTGKTATVTEVIRSLQESVENMDLPSFKYINVNGMRLSEPRQSYVEIAKQLMGKTVHWEQAQTMLENRFVKSQKKSAPIILVVDELDILCTKRQDVVYNLLDWPTKANAQLIVITIANTMDLPERLLMGRVTSRLGLTRLTFQAYTHKQLQEIVSKRLSGISAFNPDAIQLVARKVASVSGDARRALDICRRAVEIAELEGKHALVSMIHVNQALNAMITQPKVQAIKRCSRLEKLILQAVVAEVERTGVEETNFASILTMLVAIAALDGFQMVSSTIAMAAVSKLGACRLLLTDQKCNNMYQRIILNVSTDDVYYALTKTDI